MKMRRRIAVFSFVAIVAAYRVTQLEVSNSMISQIVNAMEDENIPYDWNEREEDPSLQKQQETDHQELQPPARPKKFYAIHIGPSKTGTTAIQYDMARIASLKGSSNTFAPDKDNVIYVGKRVGKNGEHETVQHRAAVQLGTNKTSTTINISPGTERRRYMSAIQCMQRLMDDYYNSTDNFSILNDRLDFDEETRNSLKLEFLQECWIHGHDGKKIDFSYMLNFSIVDSDEGYSYTKKHSRNGQLFRIFDILGYERLLVVGAYRRYADWMVSAYTQSIKAGWIHPNLEGRNLNIPCNPLRLFIERTSIASHRVRFYDPISVTLPESLEMGPSKLQAKVLNFFQLPHSSLEETHGFQSYNSITTELYCHAFGEELTPHTCRHALKVKRQKEETIDSSSNLSSLIANKGGLSTSVYQQIMASGYRYGFLDFSVEDKSCEGKKKRNNAKKQKTRIWCESLSKCMDDLKQCISQTQVLEDALKKITFNGTKTILKMNTRNITTFQDLSDYHTKVHKKSWTTSLPILCPRKEILDSILKQSLALEEMVMPEFYRSPLGKEKHVELFWGKWLQKKKIFCWVDLLRLFEGATSWDEIVNERMVNYDWGEPMEYIKGQTKELAW